MKIGSIDILKAYLGALELTSSNAFIGNVAIIDNPTPIEYAGLKMTSTGNSTVALAQNGSAPTVDLKYSLNEGRTWTQWDYSAISLTDGQTVCFKGQNTTFATSASDYNKFVMTGSVAASGNIMSIIDNGACNTTTIPATYCFCSLFRECDSLTTVPELPATTLADSCYFTMFIGSGLTSIPYDFLPATTLATNCYRGMFQDCVSLTTVPTDLLPATTLQNYCYRSMFYNCVSLTQAPELLATTLVQECYSYMFQGDTSLNYIKCLATNISASNCTLSWVNGVAATGTFVKAKNVSWSTGVSGIPTGWTAVEPYKGLKMTSTGNSTVALAQQGSAPTVDLKYSLNEGRTWTQWDYSAISLNDGDTVCLKGQNTTFATNTSNYNYFVMTGSISASGDIMSIIDDGACNTTTIPATNCFAYLFNLCTALKSAPDLSATVLTDQCYIGMFRGCTSLVEPPVFLANTLAYNCCANMFRECASLIRAPYLGATTLASYCYSNMFVDCTSLVEVQQTLPATQLSNYCYRFMFSGCTALTTAPELPATVLTQSCYYGMFRNCTNLNYIKCLATNISATDCTTNWVDSVASIGTFVKAKNVSWSTGVSGIPTGWTAIDDYKGLKMKSTNSNTKVSRVDNGTVTSDLKYSLDEGVTWYSMSNNDEVSLPEGQEIYFKGNNTSGFNTSTTDYTQIKVISGDATISGNIMSLIDNGACTTTTIPNNYCFFGLFKSSRIKNIPNAGFLPATTLTEGCYQDMFNGCTLVTGAIPSGFLPATTLQPNCYATMFYNTRITSIPENLLPATTLAPECYRNLFRHTNITTIPDKLLQATTLAENCYTSMFADCILVEDVPLNLLPATSLTYGCYKAMFQGCTGIKNVPYLPATTFSGNGPYVQMFNNCTSITAVPYDLLPATSLTNYCYEKMFTGCTSLQNAPQLPATTMKTGCYANMFEGCTSLVVAPELHASTLVSTCYQRMFDGCTNLRYINCWATNNSSGAYTTNWVRGVSSLNRCLFLTGDKTNWTTGDNGIPTNWKSSTISYNSTGLSFTAVGNVNLYLQKNGSWNKTVRYTKYDSNGGMSNYDLSTDSAKPTVIYDGETIFIFCSSYTVSSSKAYPTFNTSTSDYATFVMTGGNVYANGNIFSLCFGRGGVPPYKVLYNNNASFLFYKLFYNANHLITSPILYCGSRHNPSAASSMYRNMFEGCTEMVVASPLYETTLSVNYIPYAFKNCSHLVVAPRLNALTLRDYCYKQLFRGCSRLGQVICKATTSLTATDCIKEWLTFVRSNGTLYVDSTMTSASWGVPEDWTVKAA